MIIKEITHFIALFHNPVRLIKLVWIRIKYQTGFDFYWNRLSCNIIIGHNKHNKSYKNIPITSEAIGFYEIMVKITCALLVRRLLQQ